MGGVQVRKRGMRVVVFTVMGPAQVLGGRGHLCSLYSGAITTDTSKPAPELYCCKLVSMIRCSGGG